MVKVNELGPNSSLIGKLGSRNLLSTPALVLDLDCLEHNIERMKNYANSKNIALRPHCKTHKSVIIAQLQIDAGARGITAATLGEAEVMADANISGILVSSPVIADSKIDRLMNINKKVNGLLQTVDNISNVLKLSAAAKQAGKSLNVLIDVDVGLHRTGVASVNEALEMVNAIVTTQSLNYAGIQGYAGHIMHIESFDERERSNLAQMNRLREVCFALSQKKLSPNIITGAGTGTYDIDAEQGIVTEMQVGSYVFMDVEYLDVKCKRNGKWIFKPSLFVRSTVVSANHPDHATIDAGLKCFSQDGPLPVFNQGTPVGSTYKFFGDEHGSVMYGGSNERLDVGSIVECLVPHCDPTVNLYDFYHCVRGDTLVDIWPIDARGLH